MQNLMQYMQEQRRYTLLLISYIYMTTKQMLNDIHNQRIYFNIVTILLMKFCHRKFVFFIPFWKWNGWINGGNSKPTIYKKYDIFNRKYPTKYWNDLKLNMWKKNMNNSMCIMRERFEVHEATIEKKKVNNFRQ